MPFKSEKQMRYMYAQHPNIARRWVKEEKAKAKKEKRVPNYVVAKSAFGVEHAEESVSKAGFGSLLRLGASGAKEANAAAGGVRAATGAADMSNVASKPKDILSSVRSAKANAGVKPRVPGPRPTGFKGTGTAPTPKPSVPSVKPVKPKSTLAQGAKGFGQGLKTGRVPNATPSGVRSGSLKPLTKPQQSFQSGAKAGAKVRNAPAAAKGKLVRTGRNINSSVRGGATRATNAARNAASRTSQRGKLVALKADMKARSKVASAKGKLTRTGQNVKTRAADARYAASSGYARGKAGEKAGKYGGRGSSVMNVSGKAGGAAGRLVRTGSKAKAGAKAAPGQLKRVASDSKYAAQRGYAGGKAGTQGGRYSGRGTAAMNAAGGAGRATGKLVRTGNKAASGAKSASQRAIAAAKASRARIKAVKNGPVAQTAAPARKETSAAAAALTGGALVGAGAGGATLLSRRRQEK